MDLSTAIKAQALALGFDMARILHLGPPRHGGAFAAWLAAGLHGEMGYLAERSHLRANPAKLAPGAASVIMLAANYNPGPPPAEWRSPAHGRIARYAWSRDYHDVIKTRLYALDAFIREGTGRTTQGKVCVDTAPFLERDFAEQAGLGFLAKNTVLITPGLGSWTFLAALLVPEVLEYDFDSEGQKSPGAEEQATEPSQLSGASDFPRWRLTGPDGKRHVGTCGACTRCLTACPTQAFVGPYVLDARRCISYLTIELRGPIPAELRPAMGNWVFGCDVCQEACPYNRDAAGSAWPSLAADPVQAAPPLLDLLALDEAGFRARYRGSALMRTKRRGLVRNACVAAGNWGDPAAVPALAGLLSDGEPLVRGHAAWALGRMGGPQARAALSHALTGETDGYVRSELIAALESGGDGS
jgi:epoxyqueuosine reductase